ncbi:N-acetyl-alpha-D-glucosaminyl L-malate synthase [Microcoleus sp. IPMA8]|uniref:N-acetyl-alpha-D-glucosaminyl L-malate synthase n=2 Tax=Microcoleus TaxID=44471 RepID=A0ABX2D2V3_9CYAN|nr:N-acetyl-alpha-D-glucosaminyl L-malate synthase [Microcoleus asticus IPMA8]
MIYEPETKNLWSTDFDVTTITNMSKHIFLYTLDPGVGGVAQNNHLIMCTLARLGYQVTCVQPPAYDDRVINFQKQLGIQHLWVEAKNKNNSRGFDVESWQPTLINSSPKPSLIICSNTHPFASFAVKQIAIPLGIPYIVIENLVLPDMALRFVEYLDELSHHYIQAKSVIAVSYDDLGVLHRLFKLPKNKGKVIYYGRPVEYFTPCDFGVRDRLRQSLNIPTDAVVCFTAARIELRKGYQYQLEAIKQLMLSSVWSQLYFVWAGGGIFEPQLEKELQQAVEQLEITDKIKFLGQVTNVSEWLDTSDIFILPSVSEAFGMSIAEAMAKGLPVIATAVGGIPEVLGNTGKLLPDPNIDSQATVRELVTTIQDWVMTPQLRHDLGQHCKQRAEEMFREERSMKEVLEVIERVLLLSEDTSHEY